MNSCWQSHSASNSLPLAETAFFQSRHLPEKLRHGMICNREISGLNRGITRHDLRHLIRRAIKHRHAGIGRLQHRPHQRHLAGGAAIQTICRLPCGPDDFRLFRVLRGVRLILLRAGEQHERVGLRLRQLCPSCIRVVISAFSRQASRFSAWGGWWNNSRSARCNARAVAE